MKLFVDAPSIAAALLRTERDEHTMLGALVVRKRFGLREGGGLGPVPEGKPPAEIRYETVGYGDYGEMAVDEIPPRNGTDVIVIGDAVPPEKVVATRVEVEVGPYHVAIDVLGDRVWESVLGALVASSPKPFTRMPITYAHAYGGASSVSEYGPIPWFKNPRGKGYYIKSSEAKDGPLPNLESPNARIKQWDDRPDPVGLAPYPAEWGLKWEKYIEPIPEKEDIEIHPDRGMYDRAHPLLTGKPVPPGPMRIRGMGPKLVQFEIPPCPVEARIGVGATSAVRDLELEEVLVDLREGLVDLTWRKMFRYNLVAYERRETFVVEKGKKPSSVQELR